MALVARPFVWFYHEFGVDSIASTGRNVCPFLSRVCHMLIFVQAYLIILSRALRMFAYGTNTLILGIDLSRQLRVGRSCTDRFKHSSSPNLAFQILGLACS